MKTSINLQKLIAKHNRVRKPKKNPNADVGRNGSVYFAVGLLLMLVVVYNTINYKSYQKSAIDIGILSFDEMEEIDVINIIPETPPPPPPPAVFTPDTEIADDDDDIIETVIPPSDTNEGDEITKVEEIKEIEVIDIEEDIPIPVDFIQNVPIYPGCENGSNAEKRKCMSAKISKHVQKKFNINLAESLGLTGKQKIYVTFKIDKNGEVVDIQSRAPHPRLQKEAARVINLLPKMKPGKQNDKVVTVTYSLPIIFQVQD